MTHVYDDPAEFKNDVIKGFAAAYPQYVQRVEGASGFVRAGGPLEGKVSLVIGGGSGHYPSYNGVVGTGFADGAVLGDIFASPSAEQVYRIARAADGGAGVMLAFGNYAGDRLNFGVAAERLVDEGIDTRIVYVTDDIASASREEQAEAARHRRHLHGLQDGRGGRGERREPRRGRAGDARGQRRDVLLRRRLPRLHAAWCRRAAVHRWTTGQMDFGLGIHGEPGISSAPWMSAKDLADKARRDGAGRASRRTRAVGPRCSSTGSARPSTRSSSCCTATSASCSKHAGVVLVARRSANWSPASTWPAARCRSPGWTRSSKATGWPRPTPPAFRRGTAVASERFTTRRAGAGQSRRQSTAEASEESIARPRWRGRQSMRFTRRSRRTRTISARSTR